MKAKSSGKSVYVLFCYVYSICKPHVLTEVTFSSILHIVIVQRHLPVKYASPKARSGKGEGAREYLGDILM